MRIIDYHDAKALTIVDKDGRISNNQILIAGDTGSGKTTMTERCAYSFYKHNYTVIFLTEKPNKPLEPSYCMFEPKSKYHLKNLKIQGIKPQTINAKIYTPFSFEMPKSHKLPPFNLFTINFRDLKTHHLSLLLEQKSKSDSVRLTEKSIERLSDNEGLWNLLLETEQLINNPKTFIGDIEVTKRGGREDFFLKESFSGKTNDISNIRSNFDILRKNYFLAPEECKLNLDDEKIKDILRNNKDFHVFTTLYIENDKLKRLIPIVLLDKFMSVMAKWDTKTDGKLNNVLFVILEGKIFLPEITIEDYIKIASNIMANRLSTVRASGIGVSTITETQNLFEFSSQCRESMSFKILGKLSSNDLGILSKIEGFNKDTRQRITNLRKGHVMISYEDDSGDIVQEEMSFLQAPYSHADEGADISFIERYSKEYPENLKNFKEEYEYMENLMEEEIKIAEQKAKRIKDKENIDIQKRRLAKVKKEEGKEKSDELKSTIKELKGKEFEDMCIKCYMAYSEGNRDGKKASLNKLAKNFGISNHTFKKYVFEGERLILQPMPEVGNTS